MLLSVMRGEVGGVELATTWIRKMSEIERLHSAGVLVSARSRKAFGSKRERGNGLEIWTEEARDEDLALEVEDEKGRDHVSVV